MTRGEAAGRVNLIGEHTDYNGGFVLPAAIPQRTRVELTPARGHDVEVFSEAVGERQRYRLGDERPGRGWLDYVQGITCVAASAGHRLGGFSARIDSTVPLGSGLSSSAALEISLLRALRGAFGLSLTDEDMARLGQRAENEFVGAPVGIMDQMAAMFADESNALFLDTRTLAYERVPIPADAALIVINSGVAHQHAGGDYRTRRAECERAAAELGVPQLRDAGVADLARIAQLPDPLSRRARHVVTENARVHDTVSRDACRRSAQGRQAVCGLARVHARRFRCLRAGRGPARGYRGGAAGCLRRAADRRRLRRIDRGARGSVERARDRRPRRRGIFTPFGSARDGARAVNT